MSSDVSIIKWLKQAVMTNSAPAAGSIVRSSCKDGWIGDPVHQAEWLLRIGVLIYVIGVGVSVFTWAGTAIGGVALMEWGVAQSQIFLAERIVVSILLLLALSLFVYPTSFALFFIGGVVFVESYSILRFGGVPFAELAPLAHALRYLAPLALIPLLMSSNIFLSELKTRIATASWILRIGLSTVFFTHGLEALWLNPIFVDLIIGSAWNMLGITVSEATASTALQIIGIIDIAVASLLLIRPWRFILIWMGFWALITALSRPIAFGIASYPEVLLRASHMIAPVVLVWLIHSGVKETSPK